MKNNNDLLNVQKALENPDNFALIIDTYEVSIRRYIQRISRFSDTELDEILQEVFLKCWQNLNSYDPTQKFSSWLYRIAHNITISEFRKHKSRGFDTAVQFNDTFDVPSNENFFFDIDIEISRKSIEKIMKLLPLNYREILILRFWEDLSYDEISDILKIPISSVGTLISRSKIKFREQAKLQNIQFN